MSDQTLFDQGNQQQETPAHQPDPQSLFADQLKEIKDESGRQKYNSPEEALKALRHSQEYIPSLKGQLSQYEQEIARLKAELEQRASVEDIVSRMKQPEQTQQEHPQATPTPAGLDEKAVFDLIQKQLSERERVAMRSTNLKQVESALYSKFGDKAKEALAAKAQELGVDMARMKQMAEETPQIVQSLFQTSAVPTPKPNAGGYNLPTQPNQQESLADKLKEAESRIRHSGQQGSRGMAEMMAQVRANVYNQFGVKE